MSAGFLKSPRKCRQRLSNDHRRGEGVSWGGLGTTADGVCTWPCAEAIHDTTASITRTIQEQLPSPRSLCGMQQGLCRTCNKLEALHSFSFGLVCMQNESRKHWMGIVVMALPASSAISLACILCDLAGAELPESLNQYSSQNAL